MAGHERDGIAYGERLGAVAASGRSGCIDLFCAAAARRSLIRAGFSLVKWPIGLERHTDHACVSEFAGAYFDQALALGNVKLASSPPAPRFRKVN